MLAAGDGEVLIVAGYFKGSEYRVLAWWNLSRGFGGNQDNIVFWVGGVFLVGGIALLSASVAMGMVGAWEVVLLAFLFIVFGAVMMRSGYIVRQAVKAVHRVRFEAS